MNQAIQKIDQGALAVLSRTELETQIVKAEARPRDIEIFHSKVHGMVARFDEETATDCHYSLPARGDSKEPIIGPSIRFAELLVLAFGNCRVGARIIEEGPEHVVAQGIFHDLESNSVNTFEVRRRIVDKKGRRYSPDMVNQTCNAACSIARRNVILNTIPRAMWAPHYTETISIAAGDNKTLAERRDQAIAAFQKLGIEEKRVLESLTVKHRDEISRDLLVQLRGTYTAIRDGELSLNEAFPAETPKAEGQTTLEDFGNHANPAPKRPPLSKQPDPLTDVDSAATAHEMGKEARRKNANRTQWPGRWRDQSNIEAWLAGWDAENAEIAENEGKN